MRVCGIQVINCRSIMFSHLPSRWNNRNVTNWHRETWSLLRAKNKVDNGYDKYSATIISTIINILSNLWSRGFSNEKNPPGQWEVVRKKMWAVDQPSKYCTKGWIITLITFFYPWLQWIFGQMVGKTSHIFHKFAILNNLEPWFGSFSVKTS